MLQVTHIIEKISRFISRYWPIIWIVGVWIIFSSPYIFQKLVPFPSKYLVDFFPPWSDLYAHPVKNNAMPDVITQIYPWATPSMDIPIYRGQSLINPIYGGLL